MASNVLLKRHIGGTQKAPTGANLEGDAAIFFPGAAGDSTKPVLYLNDGGGWRVANPDVALKVTNWAIGKPAAGWGADAPTDINALAAAKKITSDEIAIVSWNGNAYAFTGGAGDWGATGAASPGTPVTAAMLAPLGSASPAPVNLDFNAGTAGSAANIGAAYTAWAAAGGKLDPSGVNFANFKGTVYLLNKPAAPGTAGSWQQLSEDIKPEVIDFGGMAAGISGAADIGAAYTAWHTGAGAPDYTGSIVIVRYGSPAAYYMLVDDTAPGTASSYTKISPNEVNAVSFKTTLDVTTPLPDTVPYSTWQAGDFAIVATTGTVDTTDNAGGNSWDAILIGEGATVKQGDMLVYDGTNLHVIAQETDLSAYMKLVGGTIAKDDGTGGVGVIDFELPAALGAGTLATRLDGKDAGQSALDNFTIDCGTYTV